MYENFNLNFFPRKKSALLGVTFKATPGRYDGLKMIRWKKQFSFIYLF